MAEKQKGETAGAQAIRRAVDIMRVVAHLQRSGASLSRVARAADISTSTAYRILRSLVEERLLHYENSERRYYIGPLASELGLASTLMVHMDVESRWRPALESIARQTRLTTYLMARSHQEVVCLACIQGQAVLRAMPVDVGQRLPLGIGAGSLAILATLDDSEVHDILASQSSLLKQIQNEVAGDQAILERLAVTKQRGFSVSSGTIAAGVAGVGVAIIEDAEPASLAISVSAVAKEFPPKKAQELADIIQLAIKDCRLKTA